MKYRDLVKFEPIESVLKLCDANDKTRAKEHAETFVMSSNLADRLTKSVFPQLQVEAPQDNKGILIVGNYGTGKTHLMSIISSVCEYSDVLPDVGTRSDLLGAMKLCQGRFKVIRITIGGTLKGLRDIICDGLSGGLKNVGVTYAFPSQREVTNHSDSFQEMMSALDKKHPGKGLLLVVDELLDYLKARDEQDLIRDLSFLREIGEISKDTRFRFMAGLQESLFDNPSWSHVAESVRRVRDRFEQLRIIREDVETVVGKRLLSKDGAQKKLIREHLEKFTVFYENLQDRMDEFVDLYPVHPMYLEVFERIHIAERREILKTLSRTLSEMMDNEVPMDESGTISFDSYWSTMINDPSLLSIPEVKEVLDRSRTLEEKIVHQFPKKIYKPAAISMIHGLAVHRLTTPDIYAKIGLSPKELRDGLFIMIPDMPQKSSEMLEGLTTVIMKDILSTVNGQYISKNEENAQYYIDVQKAVDYDQNIADRGAMLSEDQKDSAYFDAMRKIVLENPDVQSYVRGYRIWEHEVLWPGRNTDRPGYIFFGAPNERSTAQPPRDFYLYFLQPFNRPTFRDEKKPDEVFFDLLDPKDDGFHDPLVKYAAAMHLSRTQSHVRQIYEEKAEAALRDLVEWLNSSMPTKCKVTWKGERKLLKEWSTLPGPKREIRDIVEGVASACLASHFEDQYPEYPTFGVRVSKGNRDEICKDALREIASPGSSRQGRSILDALELMDGSSLNPAKSKYAQPVLDTLRTKRAGQVVNRKELIDAFNGNEVERTTRIEPSLFGVVLSALCYSGEIVLSYQGEKVDASNFGILVRKSNIGEVARFKHVEKPRGLDVPVIKALCRLFGVNENMAKDAAMHIEMLRQIHEKRSGMIGDVVETVEWLKAPPLLWDITSVTPTRAESCREELNKLKEFVESLQSYDTPAKMPNLKWTENEISSKMQSLELLRSVAGRRKSVAQLSEPAVYVQSVELLLPLGDPFRKKLPPVKSKLAELLARDEVTQKDITEVVNDLKTARTGYIEAYVRLHKAARLGQADDERKKGLLANPDLKMLQKLSTLPLVDANRLDTWISQATGLKTCFALVPNDLQKTAKCPHCDFNPEKEPTMSSSVVLGELENELSDMVEKWTEALANELEDPTVRASMKLLNADQQKMLEAFTKTHEIPVKDISVFVSTYLEIIGGLKPVQISMDEVRLALLASGSAGRVEDVRKRFDELLKARTSNMNPERVRIVFVDRDKDKKE